VCELHELPPGVGEGDPKGSVGVTLDPLAAVRAFGMNVRTRHGQVELGLEPTRSCRVAHMSLDGDVAARDAIVDLSQSLCKLPRTRRQTEGSVETPERDGDGRFHGRPRIGFGHMVRSPAFGRHAYLPG
jgi:hypothetical protein